MNETEQRLSTLEYETARLQERLARLERGPAAVAQHVRPQSVAPAPDRVEPSVRASDRLSQALARRPLDFEELLGRRLLALVGGAAVLLGVAFFVALAVDRGWIGDTARVILAFAGSTALFAAGVWLSEKRGREQAAVAAVGTAIACLYLSLAAATALYHLIPTVPALALALAIGGVATTIAVRWNTRTVAGLGIGGALLAPALSGSLTTAGMVFLAVAFASAAGVLVWRRWDWLAVGSFVVAAAQVAIWAFRSPDDATVVAVLGTFAALNLLAVLGHALTSRSPGLRPATSLLAITGAATFAGLGYLQLGSTGGGSGSPAWLRRTRRSERSRFPGGARARSSSSPSR